MAAIFLGASGYTDADYHTCPTPLGESASSSLWMAVLAVVTSQAVASKSRALLSTVASSPSRGVELRTNITNSTFYLLAVDNLATGRSSPTATIAAADVGKLQLLIGVVDSIALKLRTYHKRVEVGTATSITGYTPSLDGLRIGDNFQPADLSPDGVVIHGVAAGIGLPTLAQIQAFHDDTMANERMGSIPGMTTFWIDMTADARANGGALPATLTDRTGGPFNFARVGNIATTPHYARAWAW